MIQLHLIIMYGVKKLQQMKRRMERRPKRLQMNLLSDQLKNSSLHWVSVYSLSAGRKQTVMLKRTKLIIQNSCKGSCAAHARHSVITCSSDKNKNSVVLYCCIGISAQEWKSANKGETEQQQQEQLSSPAATPSYGKQQAAKKKRSNALLTHLK